jgi:hypothetical protein
VIVENECGYTALDYADKFGFEKLAQWLLSYGTERNMLG